MPSNEYMELGRYTVRAAHGSLDSESKEIRMTSLGPFHIQKKEKQ